MKTNVKPNPNELTQEELVLLEEVATLIQKNPIAAEFIHSKTDEWFQKKLAAPVGVKYFKFDRLSEFGLIYKINKEVLHPLGLALSREPDLNCSFGCIVAPDGIYEYTKETSELHEGNYKKFIENKEFILAPYK